MIRIPNKGPMRGDHRLYFGKDLEDSRGAYVLSAKKQNELLCDMFLKGAIERFSRKAIRDCNSESVTPHHPQPTLGDTHSPARFNVCFCRGGDPNGVIKGS